MSVEQEKIGFLEPSVQLATRMGAGALVLVATVMNSAETTTPAEHMLGYGTGGSFMLSGLIWAPEAIHRYRQSRLENTSE